MDIAAWLQGLGLERYVPAFRDNEIDWEVLPKLTSEDLREIGVAAIGHRRKLLDTIAALGPEAPAAALLWRLRRWMIALKPGRHKRGNWGMTEFHRGAQAAYSRASGPVPPARRSPPPCAGRCP